ncbi:MAG: prolipoprotein diacylglyceryl transferase [Candidatus Pelagibacter sp.]|tara:strand:- start:2248 stop:3030 length:783 start_codon:yes stop_codon:yes gene_type:complete
MFINNFDPVAFQVFSFEIRWYSLSYIFGIIFGWIYCNKILIKDTKIKDLFSDYISYLIIGILVGGRLGYVFFYNFNYYFNNPVEIVMIWSGGMSFHGALIGIIIVTIFFSKNKNINSLYFLDLVAVTAPVGIFLGRVSNFINSELYGRETEFFLSVKFVKVDNLNRHPSQIYEAIFEGLVLFIVLNYLYKRLSPQTGLISALFLILYSIFRFVIEFSREPDAQLGFVMMSFTMGQLISVFTLLAGIYLYYLTYGKSNSSR